MTENFNIDEHTLKHIIEAAILASEAPIGVSHLIKLFPEDAIPTREDMLDAIQQLASECENRGVELKRIGNTWRYQTREQYAPWLRKLNEGRPPRYSRALLETLSIIAYRQPVTRGDVEDIRGVAVSSEIMRTLQDREWVKQVGVRDVPGHPALYGTTPGFLAYFNLQSLNELPALIEQRDLHSIARDQNIEIPLNLLNAEDDAEDDAEDNAEDNAEDDVTNISQDNEDTTRGN